MDRNSKQRRAATCSAVGSLDGSLNAAVIALISVALFLSLGSSARGDGIHYNASKCADSPHGMIYVAAGRHVYHQPVENLQYVHGASLETAAGLPIAPRPSQPAGCPDHPLRGTGFKFGPFSDVTDPKAAEAAMSGLVQLIEIDSSSWWDTHERYSLSNRNACAAAGARETETIPGLTVCWSAAAGSADRRSRSPFVAIVDSRHYTGPLGQPLAIFCNPNMSANADDYACEISYKLNQDVGVWYDFHTSLIPLSGVIGFDRELRRRIEEAEVADYWWPIFPSSRPTAPIAASTATYPGPWTGAEGSRSQP